MDVAKLTRRAIWVKCDVIIFPFDILGELGKLPGSIGEVQDRILGRWA